MGGPRRAASVLAAVAIAASACSHTVTVYSEPAGADIYVNGRLVGKAPTTFRERSGYHKKHEIRAELPGYEPWSEVHEQDRPSKLLIPSTVGAYLILLPIVGVLWGYQLPDDITMVLEPTEPSAASR